MAKKSAAPKKSTGPSNRKIQMITAGVIAALILFGLIVPVTAMQFENHNSFCASCHTEGEQAFYDRSIATTPVDLASIHDIKGQARCIDCHTGNGISGRYGGLMAGATDLISYFSGHYPQPAKLEEPWPDENCMKCHANVADKQAFNNHFHVYLPKWQAADPQHAAHCVDCHASHDTTNDAGAAFINKHVTVLVCEKCHSFAGRGG